MVNKMFKYLIGDIMECYIDDMVVKSKKETDHHPDQLNTLSILRHYRIKVNPSTCTFGIHSGKFLGYMVTINGIDIDPTKIRAILDMPPPTCKKDIQMLTEKLAALNRFISRLSNRCKHFFNLLRKKQGFEWDAEYQAIFEHIETYLSSVSILSSPVPGEELYLYIANTPTVISAVLVRVEENKERPIYSSAKLARAQNQVHTARESDILYLLCVYQVKSILLELKINVVMEYPVENVVTKEKKT